MKEQFILLFEPIASIKARPFQFIVWIIVAIILGLSGFWLPPLLIHFKGEDAILAVQNYVFAGGLASFSIVILADGIASNLVAVKAGSNITAAGIRGIAGSLALILVFIQVGVLIAESIGNNNNHISIYFHFFMTALAVVISSYLYCFRFPDWEKGVEKVKEEEDQEVEDLGKSAKNKTADEEGIKL